MRSHCLTPVPYLAGALVAFSSAGLLVEASADSPRLEAALCRFHVCGSGRIADAARQKLADPKPEAARAAVEEYREALRRTPGDAYRWCDTGQALFLAGDAAQARIAFGRAVELAPNTPAVLLQAAGFHLRAGTPAAALPLGARTLALFRDYDSLIFLLYQRSGLPIGEVLNHGLPADPAAARSFFAYVIENDTEDAGDAAWKWLGSRGYLDDRTASAYAGHLVERHRYTEAAAAWSGYAGKRASGYPGKNLVFNGDFEMPFSGCVLDWSTGVREHVEEARDASQAHSGNTSLRVGFDGTTNVDYIGTYQVAIVEPGTYRLAYWGRAEGVTTDRGVALQVFDPENPSRLSVETPELKGSQDWTLLEIRFAVRRPTRTVRVQVVRHPSWKFDNKISGRVWLDQFVLHSLVP
jgi:tetratricopeptide (TPR) repeat protein